jgi:uncharacterized metal-binding protein YceD (DUF177 family)
MPGAEVAEISLEGLVLDLDEVQRLGPGPHRAHAELDRGWLAEALRDTDARAEQPGSVGLELTMQGDGSVLLRGRLSAGFTVPCARCLAPAPVDASASVWVTAVPMARLRSEQAHGDRGAADDPDGVHLGEDDLDRIGYEGRRIEVGRILAELVLVAYPMRALCARGEACAGLCSGCGRDLNRPLESGSGCPTCRDGPSDAPGAQGAGGGEAAWKAALRKLSQS